MKKATQSVVFLNLTKKVFLSILLLFIFTTCKRQEEPLPEITQIDPLEATIGSPIKITGKFLATVQMVSFGSVSTSPIERKPTELTVIIPGGTTLGNVKVTANNDVGASNPIDINVLAAVPSISKITPVRAGAGMEVKISGFNLITTSQVNFNTKAVLVSTISDTVVTVKVPSGLTLGATNVTLKTEGGISNQLSFTVVGTPTITSFTPTTGPINRVVTITGTYLNENPIVKFNQTVAIIDAKTPTQITTKVPSGASNGKIYITTDGGADTSATDFIIKDAPSITSFTPSSGFAKVTVVTITGSNLSNATSVTIGGGTATVFSENSDTKITFTLPSGASTGKFTVNTPAGSGVSNTDFTVTGSPVITSFTPTQGLIGTTVTITGSNLLNATSLTFNGAAATIPNNNGTTITTTVPSGATTGKIGVTTGGGTAFSTANFTALIPPTITNFTPTSGLSGTQVTITGTNFSGASVAINGTNASIISNTGTQIVVTVPNGASTGKITVVTLGGTGTSANNFLIPPSITTLNPTEGLQGSNVVITGVNFNGASTVKFGTTNSVFTVNSNTQITATVPSGTTGAVNVNVTTSGGTSNNATFLITVAGAKPSLLSAGGVIPNQNVIGRSVLVKGTGLVGVISLKFGNMTLSPDSKTDIALTFVVPNGFADNTTVDISVVANTGTSNKVQFKVVNVSNMGNDGVPNAPGVTIVNTPPPNYVPNISNAWTNSQDSTDQYFPFVDQCNCASDPNPTQCVADFVSNPAKNQGNVQVNHNKNGTFSQGTFSFDIRKVGNTCNNYIEMNIDGITYVGRYDYKNGDSACGSRRVILLSSVSGKQLILNLP